MFQRNQMQARGALKVGGQVLVAGTYPTVPAAWPNRAARRAVKQGRESRLPAEWRQFLTLVPGARAGIRGL